MQRFLVFILLAPLLAYGQVSIHLSLSEAEALWRQHSHELRLNQAVVAGALADVQVAGQLPNPQASLNMGSISPSTGFGAGHLKDKMMDTQLHLEQLIERGGKKELRVKSAEARLAAVRKDVLDAGRQQLITLQMAYYDLLLAQEKSRLAQEAAELYGKGAAVGQLRLKAGDIAPVDLSRLQIDKARADNEARQAQADLEVAQVALAYLIGRENEAGQLVATATWPSTALPEVLPLPLAQRPAIEAARFRLQAAESARDLARAQKKRDVTVGVLLERNNQGTPTNSYGFGVSVPLFVWHEYEGEIARAEAEFDAARVQYEQVQAQGVSELAQWRTALLSAVDRQKRLETGLLADAERVAKAAEFAYSKGAMGLMDLLDARRTLRQIQLEAANARADYAKALAAWRSQMDLGKIQ